MYMVIDGQLGVAGMVIASSSGSLMSSERRRASFRLSRFMLSSFNLIGVTFGV